MRALRGRKTDKPWSWPEVGERTLAVYQSSRGGRLRTAVLVWQRDDPRVRTSDGRAPALLAFTMDLAPDLEPGEGNAVELAGFEALEEARSHCVEWTGEATEASWESLGETEQIGVYASIREPSFASAG